MILHYYVDHAIAVQDLSHVTKISTDETSAKRGHPTVEEASALVDYSLSPRKHGEDYPLSSEFNQNDNDYDPLGG